MKIKQSLVLGLALSVALSSGVVQPMQGQIGWLTKKLGQSFSLVKSTRPSNWFFSNWSTGKIGAALGIGAVVACANWLWNKPETDGQKLARATSDYHNIHVKYVSAINSIERLLQGQVDLKNLPEKTLYEIAKNRNLYCMHAASRLKFWWDIRKLTNHRKKLEELQLGDANNYIQNIDNFLPRLTLLRDSKLNLYHSSYFILFKQMVSLWQRYDQEVRIMNKNLNVDTKKRFIKARITKLRTEPGKNPLTLLFNNRFFGSSTSENNYPYFNYAKALKPELDTLNHKMQNVRSTNKYPKIVQDAEHLHQILNDIYQIVVDSEEYKTELRQQKEAK